MKSTYISYECDEQLEMDTKKTTIRFSINIYCDECQTVHTFILKPVKTSKKQ
jgi:hypothetical protein